MTYRVRFPFVSGTSASGGKYGGGDSVYSDSVDTVEVDNTVAMAYSWPAVEIAETVAPTLRAPQSDDPALQDDGVEEHTVSRRDTRTTDDSSVGAASVIVIADPGSPTQAPVGDHGLPMRRSFTRPVLTLPGTVVEVADATPPAPTHATLRPSRSNTSTSSRPRQVVDVAGAIVRSDAKRCVGVWLGV